MNFSLFSATGEAVGEGVAGHEADKAAKNGGGPFAAHKNAGGLPPACCCFWPLLSVDANGLLPQMTGLETDHAVDLGKQGIVLADPDVDAGMEVGAPLAHEDVPRQHGLTVCLLGSKTLAFAVSAVTGRAPLMPDYALVRNRHGNHVRYRCRW